LHELLNAETQLAEVDEEVGEAFLMEQPVDGPALQAAIRRATLALQFVPVFVGSAYKNKVGGSPNVLSCSLIVACSAAASAGACIRGSAAG
jgi:translation elongation factor EF-G